MKVGLLQCDDVRESLQVLHGNYPEMFETILRQRLPEMDYRVYRALDGELPGGVDECDVYLTTGSKSGVNDGQHWIKGWGVGMSFNDVLINKPWMQPTRKSLDLIVSHQDQVVRLPPHAEILARSDFCPYYLLQYGQHFMSVQGHPEFCKAYSADLMDARRDVIPATRYRAGQASLSAVVDDSLMLDWIVNFLQQAR